jgi:hypothetical protein
MIRQVDPIKGLADPTAAGHPENIIITGTGMETAAAARSENRPEPLTQDLGVEIQESEDVFSRQFVCIRGCVPPGSKILAPSSR